MKKWLDGDYPVDFLNCELEIKNILFLLVQLWLLKLNKEDEI